MVAPNLIPNEHGTRGQGDLTLEAEIPACGVSETGNVTIYGVSPGQVMPSAFSEKIVGVVS